MKQVPKDQFYAAMNPLDVHPSIQPGRWPYTSLWKERHSDRIRGKSVGHTDGTSDYFLPEVE